MCNKSLPGSARRSRTKHAPRKKCCDADQCSIFACTYIFSPGNRNGLSSCTVRKTTSEPPVFYIRASRARDKMTKSHGACDGRDPSRRKLILMDNSGQQGNNLNGNRKRGKVFAGSGSDSTKLCTNLIHAIPKLTIAPWVSSIPASCSCLSQWHHSRALYSFTNRKFCEDRNAEIAPLDLVLYLYHSHSPEVELVLFSLRWSSGENVHSRNFTAFRAQRKKGARKGGLRGMVARLITYHNTRTGKQNRYPVRRECTTVQIALSN